MTQPAGLDDPRTAAHAWRRFRRILWWSTAAGAAAGLAVWWLVARAHGPLGWFATIAIPAGICLTVLTTGALMGLVFLSSGTGHDEAVRDFRED